MLERTDQMIIGIDASALVNQHTGIGNYISPILETLQRTQPQLRFILYSNRPISFPKGAQTSFRVSNSNRRGPYWQNTTLLQMLHADRPDVFWGASGFLPISTPRRTATVITLYDMVYRFAPKTMPLLSRWGRRLFQPIAARQADRIVAISAATASDVSAYYGRNADAIVPPVVDAAFIPASRHEVVATLDKLQLPSRYFLSLGTLEPRKNTALLIKAYLARRQIHTQLPCLVIAGKQGWLDEDITQMIAMGEQQGCIRHLGYVDKADLPALYQGCDAFIMPSLYEGYGMPILEAQLSGAAVVHGPHAAMCEASDNLGLVYGTDYAPLCQLFDDFANNTLPLTCRTRPTYTWNAEQAAQIMLKQFTLAYQARQLRLNR